MLLPRARGCRFFLLSLATLGSACTPSGWSSNLDDVLFERESGRTLLSFSGVSEEPVFPVGGGTSPEEAQAVQDALNAFDQDLGRAAFHSIDRFLLERPTSRYSGPLALSAGLAAYEGGYFGKAMDYYRFSWKVLAKDRTPEGRTVADRALAELGQMHCRFGTMGAIRSVLRQSKVRGLSGMAKLRMDETSEALWSMEKRPGVSFQCGPIALDAVSEALRGKPSRTFRKVRSTQQGTSFAQLMRSARADRLPVRAVHRVPGAEVVVPAVVHWKRGHFGALLRREGDRYLMVDPTFNSSHWVKMDALDEEASGYFLVKDAPLQPGFDAVSDAKFREIRGKSVTNIKDVNRTKESDVKVGAMCAIPSTTPMAQYAFHAMLCSLNVWDTPIAYQPPVGPSISCRISYVQRDNNQPTTFTFSNMGAGWKAPYVAYVVDNPRQLAKDTKLVLQGGGAEVFKGAPSSTGEFARSKWDRSVLVRTSIDPIAYERRFLDGSVEVYNASNDGATTRYVFLSSIRDAWGNAVSVRHQSGTPGKVTSVVDAQNKATRFLYETSDPYKVTKIIDPFGRTAKLAYTAEPARLQSITDPVGIVSSFAYVNTSHFMQSMTTPYGTTKFSLGSKTVNGYYSYYAAATDPVGLTERVEYWANRNDVPYSEPVPSGQSGYFNGGALNYRNSYYWDKQNYALNEGDYSLATIYHWLISNETDTMITGVLESVKSPLRGRTWFRYQGQESSSYDTGKMLSATPMEVARVDRFGNTIQDFYGEFNDKGLPDYVKDGAGRQTRFLYDGTGTDVIAVEQGRGSNRFTVARFENYVNHTPQTIVDGSGQSTKIAYNGEGQVAKVTNPLGQSTTLSYDTSDRLAKVLGPKNETLQTLTYDEANRVRTVQDAAGLLRMFSYDNIDRVTSVLYPDGTSTAVEYKHLDPAKVTDRRGRVTNYTFDALRQLRQVRDPMGRSTLLDWCRCGSLRRLVDPEGGITSWTYDAGGRLITKTYPDHYTENYLYDSALGNLSRVYDGRGQIREFTYTDDNRVATVSARNVKVATPTLRYYYDSSFPRLSRTVDERGETNYDYYPYDGATVGAGMLKSVDGPLSGAADQVAFSYDKLFRRASRTFGGSTVSWTYDALGRLLSETNPLGEFGYRYQDSSDLLTRVLHPVVGRRFSYSGADEDARLVQIDNTAGTVSVSKFGYHHDAEGMITSWSGAYTANGAARSFSLGHDAADQLVQATLSGGAGKFAYAYDDAGNRTRTQTPTETTVSVPNPLNQIVSDTVTGPSGLIEKNAYTYDGNGNLSSRRQTPASGPATTTELSWDAYDQLRTVERPDTRSDFSYDAQGRWARIVDNVDGWIATRDYVWDGIELIGEISSVGTKRYFAQGFVLPNGTKYQITRDHLGSVREVLSETGQVVNRYQYDPYGNASVESPTGVASERGYTGHFTHAVSGLVLAPFRAYSPRMGRWMSRDPLKETASKNLYSYVEGSPANLVDKRGLKSCNWQEPCPSKEAAIINNPRFRTYVPATGPHRKKRLWGQKNFHNNFPTYVETGRSDFQLVPQNECVYDFSGNLVTTGSARGTPNYYDGDGTAWDQARHVVIDSGGIRAWVWERIEDGINKTTDDLIDALPDF
ncbi:hypothetical protein EON79_04995 [bacterium]|nr:MAG: hypothetical protein EON79_04995 [bacterium]